MLGTPVGTPAYMAPEQARGDAVDERADVYGLGALLYYVLSGHAPYTGSSPRDVLAQVLGGPPQCLAARLPEVPTDLVTIVQKAMMHSPTDRYPTAKDMAEDLRRFAAGRLVSVHAYSFPALARRWVQKNRAAVMVAAALLTLGAISAWLSVDRIIHERNRAESERAIATTHHTAAEGLVKFLITEFRTRVSRADRLDLLEGLDGQVSQYYDSVSKSGAPVDPLTLSNQAATLQSLGYVAYERNNLAKARDLYRRALDHWQSADRGDATPLEDLVQQGRAWRALGLVEFTQGDAAAAIAAHRQAVALADRTIRNDPDYLPGHLLGASNLESISDTLQFRNGDVEGAFAAGEQAIARLEPLLAKHPEDYELLRKLAMLNQTASGLYLTLGKINEAASCIEKSGELFARLVTGRPEDLMVAREYAYTFVFLAAVEIARGRLEEAMAAVNENIRRYEAIIARDPGNLTSEAELGVAYTYRCEYERRGARFADAERSCKRALGIFRAHQHSDSDDTTTTSMLVLALTNIGRNELAAQRLGSARRTLTDAVSIARGLTTSQPESGKWKEDLVTSLTWLIDAELSSRELQHAEAHLSEALGLAEDRASASPKNVDVQGSVGLLQSLAGDLDSAKGLSEEAAIRYAAARQTFSRLIQQSPEAVAFGIAYARANVRGARALDAIAGRHQEAREMREESLALLENLERERRLFPEDAPLLSALKADVVSLPKRSLDPR